MARSGKFGRRFWPSLPRGIWLRRLRIWRRVWIRLQTWGLWIRRRVRIRRLWIRRRLRLRLRLLRRELLRGRGLSRLFNVSSLRVQPRIREPFHLRLLPWIWRVARHVWPGDWNVLSTVGPVLLGRGCHSGLCDHRLPAGRDRHAARTDAGCRRISSARAQFQIGVDREKPAVERTPPASIRAKSLRSSSPRIESSHLAVTEGAVGGTPTIVRHPTFVRSTFVR